MSFFLEIELKPIKQYSIIKIEKIGAKNERTKINIKRNQIVYIKRYF